MSNIKEINRNSVSKLDDVQLKQKIIHLQAELSRYKEIVKDYQTNYHYNKLDELAKEIEKFKNSMAEKEEEVKQIKFDKKEVEEHVMLLVEKNREVDETYSELKERLEQLEKENSLLKVENEKISSENHRLQKDLEQLEEEVMKLRAEREVEKNIFKPKRASVSFKKEGEGSDSWFLRTIKQNNKSDN